MTWLIILDNGQVYEDRRHEPVAACKTNEAAKELLAIIERWLADRPREDDGSGDLDMIWQYDYDNRDTRHRWPFHDQGLVPDAARGVDSFVTICYVPDWPLEGPP